MRLRAAIVLDAGGGALGRMVKKAMTGEGTPLMKVEPRSGEVFLADLRQMEVQLVKSARCRS